MVERYHVYLASVAKLACLNARILLLKPDRHLLENIPNQKGSANGIKGSVDRFLFIRQLPIVVLSLIRGAILILPIKIAV
jgi:hypothetical protein